MSAELPESHLRFREDFWEFIREHGLPPYRDPLLRLLVAWEGNNISFYGDELVAPFVFFSPPSSPRAYGDCGPVSGFGARSQIRLRPSLLDGTHPHIVADAPMEGRLRFLDDVLLHEQIHQWQQEVTGERETGYHGHGPGFRDRANEIGEVLGLPPVRTSKRRGADAHLPSCAYWPHNVRPGEWYLGAYIRPGRNREDPCPLCSHQASLDRTVSLLVGTYGLPAVRRALRGQA